MEPSNQANTLILDESALKQSKKPNWFSIGKIIKLFFILILAGVAVELFLGVKSLNEPSLIIKKQPNVFKNAAPIGQNATLVLLSEKNEVKVGEQISVNLKISTFGRTVKDVLAVIKYDPKQIDVSSDNFFTKGDGYSINPLVTKNSLTGTIRITGQTGSPTSGFTGVGSLGLLKFTAKKAGGTQISINQGAQISDYFDSKNILGKTYSLDLNIK